MSEKDSVKDKMEKLREKIEWFYGDDFDYAEAVGNYRKASELAREIEKDLNGMENEIKIIAEDFAKK